MLLSVLKYIWHILWTVVLINICFTTHPLIHATEMLIWTPDEPTWYSLKQFWARINILHFTITILSSVVKLSLLSLSNISLTRFWKTMDFVQEKSPTRNKSNQRCFDVQLEERSRFGIGVKKSSSAGSQNWRFGEAASAGKVRWCWQPLMTTNYRDSRSL